MRFPLPLSLLTVGLFSWGASAYDITHFAVVRRECRIRANQRLVLQTRSFDIDSRPRALVVDANSFAAQIIDPADLDCEKGPIDEFPDSRLGLALRSAHAAPFPIWNDGVTRSNSVGSGVFLTADLCPAKADGFEHRFFDELEKISTRDKAPVPLALAVTSAWIHRHSRDFDSLRRLVETRKIAVTWVNHSASHPYRKGIANGRNFLLTPGVVPAAEIHDVEIELLSRGETPSAFFRFPGLVSDRAWIERLAEHSLIPVGSDAWLARGDVPKPGSVILVHANGNEPLGITRFLHALDAIERLGPFLPLAELF